MNTKDRWNQRFLEIAADARSQGGGTISLLIFATSLLPRLAPAVVEPAAEEASSFFTQGLLIVIGISALAALVVTVVTKWSRKQDHLNEMVAFCMRFLVDSRQASEGCEAATALGRAKDPRAILVLLDVVNDQQADQTVRKAAAKALSAVSTGYRKYKQVISELISASETQDNSRLIEILTLNFEKSGAGYVQSAHAIGCAYMRQGHYADAKEWFRIAETRNNITPFYGNQIRRLIFKCDQRLFTKGDELFKLGEYHQARERYSAASHGLSDVESLLYSSFLRLACVYCKLGAYDAADQAGLHALKNGQETDMSLALNKLLQQVLDLEHPRSTQQHQRVVSEIDNLATEIMEKLYVRTTNKAGGEAQPPTG